MNEFPGHIACDASSKSELVIPLVLPRDPNDDGTMVGVGVLDIDSAEYNSFDEQDRIGLTQVTETVVRSCDWTDIRRIQQSSPRLH